VVHDPPQLRAWATTVQVKSGQSKELVLQSTQLPVDDIQQL